MVDEPNIVLEQLRLIREDIGKVDKRLVKVESDIGGLIEIMVGLAGSLHHLGERVARLERS